MLNDPRMLLRGLVKLVAVVLVAGLVGTGVGIALAKLSGSDDGGTPALPAAVSATSAATTSTQTPPTTGTSTGSETATPDAAGVRTPRVEVLSARLGSRSGGRAPVTATVRVTNRGGRPLPAAAPALLSARDEVALDASGTAEAGPLLRAVSPGASATGTLRFTLPAAVARRLTAKPAARLAIAGRIVALRLTKASS